jgi:hypothetical protein
VALISAASCWLLDPKFKKSWGGAIRTRPVVLEPGQTSRIPAAGAVLLWRSADIAAAVDIAVVCARPRSTGNAGRKGRNNVRLDAAMVAAVGEKSFAF